MTLIVAVVCPEGIVIAADSKRTHQKQVSNPLTGQTEIMDSGFTATADKIILSDNNVAIAIQGDVMVNGQGAWVYLQEFINRNPGLNVTDFAKELGAELFSVKDKGDMRIFIAGYEKSGGDNSPQLFELNTKEKTLCDFQDEFPIARWIGEVDIMNRIFDPYCIAKAPSYAFPYQAYTLQSAVDYAILGIETTIRVMALQDRPQTVGFPIDVLLIKPDGVQWLQKKEVHV